MTIHTFVPYDKKYLKDNSTVRNSKGSIFTVKTKDYTTNTFFTFGNNAFYKDNGRAVSDFICDVVEIRVEIVRIEKHIDIKDVCEFEVGNKVLFRCGIKGTITSIDNDGYMKINFDNPDYSESGVVMNTNTFKFTMYKHNHPLDVTHLILTEEEYYE